MVHATVVNIEEMRGKLLTMDDVRESLAKTEPLADVIFGSSQATLRLGETWADPEDDTVLTDAYLRIEGLEEYRLTKQAALEVGAYCRLPRKVQEDAPADAVQAFVNRMLAEGVVRSREMKLLVKPGTTTGTAITRPTIVPFSNLEMLDIMLAGIANKYGTAEVLADYKFSHDLERTNLRLIVPGADRVISGTRVADDSWSLGLDFQNSLAGIEQTDISGYLFRWWCTNGCTDTLADIHPLNRRQISTTEDAYDWARDQVEAVLGGLEDSLDAVQGLTAQQVAPDQVAATIRDLFTQHSVPARERERVISELAETGADMTMYDVMQSVTVVANSGQASPDAVRQLLSLGGHIAHTASGHRCGSCHRLVPGGSPAN
jgi:hypothetical protein